MTERVEASPRPGPGAAVLEEPPARRPARDAVLRWAARGGSTLVPLVVVLAGLGLLVQLTTGVTFPRAAAAYWRNAFGSRDQVAETLVQSIPLLCVGIGATVALRGGVWNIGGEGQLAAGGAAAFVAIRLTEGLPAPVGMAAGFLGGVAGGVAWALFPAVLRARRDVSEILTTLLMNYVALALLEFALTRSWLLGQRGSIIPIGPPIPPDRHLPLLWPPTRLHLGFVLVLALTVGVGLFFRSPQGFRVDLLGANPRLAAQAGMSIPRTLGALLLVSGAFSGLAGAVQLMGTEFTLSLAITGGLGFSGLLVAVLGGGRAPLTAVAALAFAALATGAGGAQNLGVPQSLVTVVQGLVLLAVFLRRRRAR